MKIAQIIGFWGSPFNRKTVYGIKGMALDLIEVLIKNKHQITVFAPKTSKIEATLSPICPIPINKLIKDQNDFRYDLYKNLYLMLAAKESSKFDIIHNHKMDFLPYAELTNTPVITTLHGGGMSEGEKIINKFSNKASYIAISKHSAKIAKKNNFNIIGTVYNGINLKLFSFSLHPKNYLTWLGRLDPEKGAHIAIKVAKKTKQNLKMAGIIKTKKRKDYWQKEIKVHLSKKISFTEHIKGKAKSNFLANSRALLFPIQWEEPFGLVMVEAMACGTPVIAFNRGSVPEIIEHGKTGFIVNNEKEMIAAIKNIDQIDRRECRKRVEKYFTVEKMVNDYEKVYKKFIKKNDSTN